MTLSGNYSQAILHTFLDIKQYTDIFREPLANNTTHFSRAYIKQSWHTESYRELTGKQYHTLFQYLYQPILRWDFHRFPSKLNYNKKLFQSSYCTILNTISKSYYQTILTLTETANSHPESQFDTSPSSIKILKNGSAFPSPGGGVGCGYGERGYVHYDAWYVHWASPEKKQPFNLPWEFYPRLHHWKFHKIVLDPLVVPRPKTKTPGNSTLFFLGDPWKFHFVFN